MTEAIILAGGRGTRLRTAVQNLPKPMASVGGRPFLTHVLDHLEHQEFISVVLSVGYKRDAIIKYFGSRYKTLKIKYSIEESPLGTGGALRQALRHVSSYDVVCLNGDTLLRLDYREMLKLHRSKTDTITLAVKETQNVSRYGQVSVQEGRIVSFQEKGGDGCGLINAGVYAINRGIFDRYRLPTVFSLEQDFLYPFCMSIWLQPYITDAYFIDIGTPEDYARADRELRAHDE